MTTLSTRENSDPNKNLKLFCQQENKTQSLRKWEQKAAKSGLKKEEWHKKEMLIDWLLFDFICSRKLTTYHLFSRKICKNWSVAQIFKIVCCNTCGVFIIVELCFKNWGNCCQTPLWRDSINECLTKKTWTRFLSTLPLKTHSDHHLICFKLVPSRLYILNLAFVAKKKKKKTCLRT